MYSLALFATPDPARNQPKSLHIGTIRASDKGQRAPATPGRSESLRRARHSGGKCKGKGKSMTDMQPMLNALTALLSR